MTVYYVFMISSIVIYYLYKADKYLEMRKLYCIFSGAIVFAMFAFRDISLGMFDMGLSQILCKVQTAIKQEQF